MQWFRSALAAFACLLGLWSAAPAQNYHNRPITFVVPFAPGGLSDVPARVLAAIMQEKTGATIVVENKTGASGVVGATAVWRAEPDGYTLFSTRSPTCRTCITSKCPTTRSPTSL